MAPLTTSVRLAEGRPRSHHGPGEGVATPALLPFPDLTPPTRTLPSGREPFCHGEDRRHKGAAFAARRTSLSPRMTLRHPHILPAQCHGEDRMADTRVPRLLRVGPQFPRMTLRYSLVWKLLLHPRTHIQDMSSLAQTGWPEPTPIGSGRRPKPAAQAANDGTPHEPQLHQQRSKG